MSWNRTYYNCSGSIIALIIIFLFSIACIIINELFSPTTNDNIPSTAATTRGQRIRILQKHCGLISNPKKCKGTSFCKLSGEYCVYKMPTNENMYANNHGVGGGGSGSGSVYNSIGAQCSGMVMKQCKKSKACSWSKNGSEEICVHSALAGGIGGVSDTDSTMLLSGGMRCQKLKRRECKQSKYCKYNQNKNGRSKCINRGGRNNGNKRNNRIADIGDDEEEESSLTTATTTDREERPIKFWPRPYYIEHVRSGAECMYSNTYPETYIHIHWLLFDTKEECCNVYDCRHQEEEEDTSNGMANSILNDEDQPEQDEVTRAEPISCATGPNLNEIESLTSQLSKLSGRYITSDCSTIKHYSTQSSFCEIPPGTCTTDTSVHYGVCSRTPSTCTMDVQLVCGCDDITYTNSCIAASNGMNVAYQGECLDEEATPLEPNGGDQDIIDISAYSTSCLWHISTEQNKTCTNLDYYPRERNVIPIGFRHQYYFVTAEDCCIKTQFGDDCIIEDTCSDD